MRIACWPADNGGCGWYRERFPAQALAAQGVDVVVDGRGPRLIWSERWEHRPGANCRVLGIAEKYPADVVVMQRPGQRYWADIIPMLQSFGTRVVVDVDDMFDAIPKSSVAYRGYQGMSAPKGLPSQRRGAPKSTLDAQAAKLAGGNFTVGHEWIDEACKLADLVTCTTPALLRRYGHGHGLVLPNLVPESYLSIYGLKRPNTVGWSGFVGTHPDDLQVTQGAVQQALRSDWSVHIIGDGNGTRTALGLTTEPTSTGLLSFDDYAPALAELELGIVPLEISPFNEAKSALKASEMAALGVPVIMSPTPDNLRLHALGVGLVAESRGQWRRLVEKLVTDTDLRYEMADKGRAVMASQTYEQHCGRWLEAWEGKAKVEAA